MDKVISKGYVDTFRLICIPTSRTITHRWSYRANARAKNVGWRIDYFFVTEDLTSQVKDSFIEASVMGSDHCPIGLQLDAS